MRAHVVRICKVNGIEINYDRHASASYEVREIWIRPIRSPLAYATALLALDERGKIEGKSSDAEIALLGISKEA